MQTEARVGVVVDGGGGRAAVARRQEQRHIGTAAHLAAGGFAGAVSKTCTAPLARLTILFQVSLLFFPLSLRLVIEKQFYTFLC